MTFERHSHSFVRHNASFVWHSCSLPRHGGTCERHAHSCEPESGNWIGTTLYGCGATNSGRGISGIKAARGCIPAPQLHRRRRENTRGRYHPPNLRHRLAGSCSALALPRLRNESRWTPPAHSARMAVIGSTPSARRVGTTHASSAAPISTTPPATSDSVSVGATPYSCC